jgi:hypothetical protein
MPHLVGVDHDGAQLAETFRDKGFAAGNTADESEEQHG